MTSATRQPWKVKKRETVPSTSTTSHPRKVTHLKTGCRYQSSLKSEDSERSFLWITPFKIVRLMWRGKFTADPNHMISIFTKFIHVLPVKGGILSEFFLAMLYSCTVVLLTYQKYSEMPSSNPFWVYSCRILHNRTLYDGYSIAILWFLSRSVRLYSTIGSYGRTCICIYM